MAIPRDKSRIILTLPDYTKSYIEYFSEKDKRTPSKEIEYIIEEYIAKLESSDENISNNLSEYYSNEYKPKEIANTIYSYCRKAFNISPLFHKHKDKDIPIEECFNEFKRLLLQDPYLKHDFDTFNGECNHVLFYVHRFLIESRINEDLMKEIETFIIDIFIH